MGEWTWMNGDSTINSFGHFGTQGVFHQLNSPPAFYEACEWTDKEGNFWLFGGVSPLYEYGDLWKFNPDINQWAWINGTGLPAQPPVYGTQGIPSPTNSPGSRGWGVPTWVDTSGNLWLFGGYAGDCFADLWKYDIATNEWAWMKGPANFSTLHHYGTMGVADPANFPWRKTETNITWTDNNNNLWVFGGGIGGSSFNNDLWKYNIGTNEWAWMKGDTLFNQQSVYGIKGVSDSANKPSARCCYAKWKDSDGNFYFFGGNDGNGNPSLNASFNDLWRYSLNTNEWTWISGDSTVNDSISNSTQCISTTDDPPPARFENRACWTIGCDLENFIFYGGIHRSFGNACYGDLWDYNYVTNEWTLMDGSYIPNQFPSYGIKTVSSPLNHPGSRLGAIGWKDKKCNLWLFGGGGSLGKLNDLWRFAPDTACPHFCNLCKPAVGIIEVPISQINLLVFPNPANSYLDISCELFSKQNIELCIYNLLGEEIFSSKEEPTQGKYGRKINIQRLSDGVYFLLLKTNGEIVAKKFVKQ